MWKERKMNERTDKPDFPTFIESVLGFKMTPQQRQLAEYIEKCPDAKRLITIPVRAGRRAQLEEIAQLLGKWRNATGGN
jgi:hypothetical protein